MMEKKKRVLQAAALVLVAALLGAWALELQRRRESSLEATRLREAWQKATEDPVFPYPETVTYTLAKMTSSGDSLMR